MDKWDVSSVLPANGNYRVSKYIQQQWSDARFSYLQTPRPDTGLLLVTQGKILFLSEGEELVARAGDVILLSKGSRYEAVILPEFGVTQDYLVNFDVDAPTPAVPPLKLLRSAEPGCADLFAQMIERSLRGEDTFLWATGQLHLLLDRVLQNGRNQSDPEKERLLHRVRELLTDGNDLPIGQIASRCGISESGLRSAFTAAYGCSPLQYRMKNKISRAKYLLESTDLSVYAIAEKLHFYDEAYFCKMFRKYTGCSPKKYLQNKTI